MRLGNIITGVIKLTSITISRLLGVFGDRSKPCGREVIQTHCIKPRSIQMGNCTSWYTVIAIYLIYFNSMGVNEEIYLGTVAAWSFVVSKNGTVHVFYNTPGQGMFYIRRNPNGTWGTPETISAFNYLSGDAPNIQLDLRIKLLPAFFNSGYDSGTVYYAHKDAAGPWQVTTLATYPTDVPKIARMVWDHKGISYYSGLCMIQNPVGRSIIFMRSFLY